MQTAWFDGHLDLAMLSVLGRTMTASVRDAGGPDLPAAVTLRSLQEGRVTHALATIFIEADGTDPRGSYKPGDVQGAKTVGLAQMRVYGSWVEQGLAKWLKPGPGAAKATPSVPAGVGANAALTIGVLIEGADAIEAPAELLWWRNHGVVAVALAWWKDSRYATGNGHDPMGPNGKIGLTTLGRELVGEMDRLGVVHDVSHLSDRALDELFALAKGRVIASHSNSRVLMGDPKNQRHLTDAAIKEIASRGGVIGLNLFSKFLRPGIGDDERASIADCVRHVEHIAGIAGGRGFVALGSDMDGGFSAARLPEGIDLPEHLDRLLEGLSGRGWSDRELQGFAFGNWARFWR